MMPESFDPNKLDTIASITSLTAGQTYTYDALAALDIDIVVYDKIIDLYATFVNKSYATPTWYDYAQYAQPTAGSIVTRVDINYATITPSTGIYKLSQLHDLIDQAQTRVKLFTN
jgi:hypothetical protein